jgi:transposase-like protein
MTTERDERAYPPKMETDEEYCLWCDKVCLVTVESKTTTLSKYLCQECGETFYL